MTFDEWCRAVDVIFRTRYDWPRSYIEDTGKEFWKEPFEQGESPEDAVSMEVSYWSECT